MTVMMIIMVVAVMTMITMVMIMVITMMMMMMVMMMIKMSLNAKLTVHLHFPPYVTFQTELAPSIPYCQEYGFTLFSVFAIFIILNSWYNS